MNNTTITRRNPEGVPAPVGQYTHITRIPRNAELFVTSGQVGVDSQGQFPESMKEQISNTFRNIQMVLASEQLTASDVIKVNIWAVDKIDWEHLYAEWGRLFSADRQYCPLESHRPED